MMKKHYLLGLALAASFAAKSQSFVDFESTTLAPDTFDNGSDLNGDFMFQGINFSNVYDTTYQFNTGFAISNMTDITTPGYGNQYSVITGSGFNSENYAVYYQTGTIDLQQISPKKPISARISNTTYSYLSMLNGDFAGKVFGDSLNANGVNDGTNGEDFFIVKIHGRTYNGDTLATVEVALADFRFADNTQDFLLDTWLDVDLQPLNAFGVIDYLSFEFESSDVGQWGINTPTYFALDDFEYVSLFGIDELELDFALYPNPVTNELFVDNVIGDISITDATGKTLYQGKVNDSAKLNTSMWNSGVYFITISNDEGRGTKKVVK